MTDVDHVSQSEMLDQFGEIVGIGVQIIAQPRLTRSSVSAAIMGDTAIAMRGQKEHLILESIRAQRPTVTEHDGLSCTPIVIIELRAVLCDECAHYYSPFRSAVWCVGRLLSERLGRRVFMELVSDWQRDHGLGAGYHLRALSRFVMSSSYRRSISRA
jgi:hypothetical protein